MGQSGAQGTSSGAEGAGEGVVVEHTPYPRVHLSPQHSVGRDEPSAIRRGGGEGSPPSRVTLWGKREPSGEANPDRYGVGGGCAGVFAVTAAVTFV